MKLSKKLTTVTPLSRRLALILFIALPILGFYLGTQFQKDVQRDQTPSQQSAIAPEEVFETQHSQLRDKIITYQAVEGDTLPVIAEKFGISEDTIRWENNLKTDTLVPNQMLQILPLTGVSHIVVKGDTVYSLAKKYKTDVQKIKDYPFNNFANPETVSLITGEKIIIPDGIK